MKNLILNAYYSIWGERYEKMELIAKWIDELRMIPSEKLSIDVVREIIEKTNN